MHLQSSPILVDFILLPPVQVARAANRELLELPGSWQSRDTEAALAVVSNELGSEQEQTRLDALHWVNALLDRDRKAVRVMQMRHVLVCAQCAVINLSRCSNGGCVA